MMKLTSTIKKRVNAFKYSIFAIAFILELYLLTVMLFCL